MGYQVTRREAWRTGLAVMGSAAILVAAGCGPSGSSLPESSAPFGHSATPARAAGASPAVAEAGSAAAEASPAGSRGNRRVRVGPKVGPSSGGTTDSRSGVVGGALFGGDGPLAAVAGQLGRKLAIVRTYYRLGDQFPFPWDASLMAEGTTLLVSLDTPSGGPTYSSIAAGRQDGTIKPFLAAVERSAVSYKLGAIYIDFEHEANNLPTHRGLGTPAQFVKAWDHIHALAEAAHLDWNQGGRLHWALIMANAGYADGLASLYWPGTSEVDIVADDGYNTGGCRIARRTGKSFTHGVVPPVSPASLFDPAVHFAAAHGALPVFIAEWGSVPYASATVRANWIQQMQTYVAANKQIYAAMYWNDQFKPCDYILNRYPSSFAALRAMGQSPDMQGRIVAAN